MPWCDWAVDCAMRVAVGELADEEISVSEIVLVGDAGETVVVVRGG